MHNVENKIENLKSKFWGAKSKIMKGILKKDRGINGVVIEVGLLIIGIVLLVLFKDQIQDFIKGFIQDCITKCEGLFNVS